MKLLRIKDDSTVLRDAYSKALVSTDMKALMASRRRLKEQMDMNHLQTDLNSMKAEIQELKKLILSANKD